MRRHYLGLLFASMVALHPPTARAADAPPPAAAPKVESFFATLKTGKVAEAYAAAFAGSPIDKKQAELEQVIALTETSLRFCGPIRDWQLIGGSAPAASFYEGVYLVRGAICPLFFRMHLYDNGSGWLVQYIYFTDQYTTAKTW